MYIIANLKQNKNIKEALEWLTSINWTIVNSKPNLRVILAPPAPFLYFFYDFFIEHFPTLLNFSVYLAGQNVSEYTDGSHTGEIGANQLKDMCKYCIVGHSERRKEGESVRQTIAKVLRLKENGITPVVCFSDVSEYRLMEESITLNDALFAYEPVNSIGTGNNAAVQEVLDIQKTLNLPKVIYGGSVDSKNVYDYINHGNGSIVGFLVGTSSLDSVKFTDLISKF